MSIYPKEKFSELLNHIPEGVKERVFCFWGNIYLCEQAAREVIAKLQQKEGVALESIDGETLDRDFFLEKLSVGSLFGGKKLIWIKNLINLSQIEPKILRNQPHYLVITAPETKNLPTSLQTLAIIVDFSIKTNEQRMWQEQLLSTFLRKTDKKITPQAKRCLLDYIGFNLFVLKNYLEMLVNYVGEEEIIDEKAVKTLVSPIKEEALFELTEKLVDTSPNKILKFLDNLLAQGIHPLAILSILAREIRCLLEVKGLEQKGKINFTPSYSYQHFLKTVYPELKREKLIHLGSLHSYSLYFIFKRACFYNIETLKQLHQKLIDVETKVKRTQKNAAYQLEEFILFWYKLVVGGRNGKY
ncbi:MAG: DNA polymerase III subunit delta [Candidatus Desulfofervidaceae bacterium]|nr:DNA polymerase III subunit delta [Candidatus Desulfofervidaceae bacterium]